MKQRAHRKRWLGLVLVIFLYLTGVCEAGAGENIPVYTSFSCTSISHQADPAAQCKALVQAAVSMEHVVNMPVEQLHPNSLAQLPDVVQPTERIGQSHGELLEQGRPERRSGGRYVEKVNGRVQEFFGVPAGAIHNRPAAEEAASFFRDRIITYIHDQDGHKGYIL